MDSVEELGWAKATGVGGEFGILTNRTDCRLRLTIVELQRGAMETKRVGVYVQRKRLKPKRVQSRNFTDVVHGRAHHGCLLCGVLVGNIFYKPQGEK